MDKFYIPQRVENIRTSVTHQDNSSNRPFVTEKHQEKDFFRSTFPRLTALISNIKTYFSPLPTQPPADYSRPLVATGKLASNEADYRAAGTLTGRRTTLDQMLNKRALWGRRFGDKRHLILFGARDWKGNVWREDEPFIERDDDEPYGYRLRGFKDAVGLKRIEQVSHFFLEHGLPTELIVRTYKVEEVIVHGRHIPIDEWKKSTVEQLKQESAIGLYPIDQEIPLQKIKFLTHNDFYIVDRDLQVPERVADLLFMTEENVAEILQSVFDWLYAAGQQMGSGLLAGTPPFPLLDARKESDVKKYLFEWLPQQMGTYLGRLHNLGVAHNFAHEQNWSLAGTLYDLDSPTGEPLGNSMTEEELHLRIKNDVTRTLTGLASLCTEQESEAPEFGVQALLLGKYPQIFAQFSAAYLLERNLIEEMKEHPDEVYDLIGLGQITGQSLYR